jgi:hypothetical protein
MKRLQRLKDRLSKLTDDGEFGAKYRQFSIFLSKGLESSLNSSSNKYFYYLQEWHPQEHKVIQQSTHIDGRGNQVQPLKIIEKAVNFLRRKFDRFKPYCQTDNLSMIKEKLKIDVKKDGFLQPTLSRHQL